MLISMSICLQAFIQDVNFAS